MTTAELELKVVGLIGYREHVVVPNVSWGLGLGHECDMLVLDNKNRFTEIELKVRVSDFKKDLEKEHGHRDKRISRLVYAMPAAVLEKVIALVPANAGIISTHPERSRPYWHRQCKHRVVEAVDAETIRKFMHLGCMRIWTLKQKLALEKHKSKNK